MSLTLTPSYWEATTFLRKRNLIIVGSGIVGLTAAIAVKKAKPHWSVLVVDRGILPHGASTKNAGFACFGSPSELLSDLDRFGWEQMVSLVEKRWRGLQCLRKLLSDKALDYQPCGGYELYIESQATLYERCLHELPELNHALSFIGKEVFKMDTRQKDHGLGKFIGMIACPYEAAINPGSMIETLISQSNSLGVQFLNGLSVLSVSDDSNSAVVLGDHFELRADFVLLATNAFTANLAPGIDLYPARNQVIVTSPIANLKLEGVYHHDDGYVYFRQVKDRILIGGARNQFGEQEMTDELSNTKNVTDYLEQFLKDRVIPGIDFRIDYRWSGILGLGNKKSPITHWQSDRIFAACRMGGMGVSIGALVGQSAAESIISR